MKWGQVLDSMLINLNAPDHSVPSFSVFDRVCMWICGSAGKYVISAVSLPVYGSHRVLLLRSPFQSGSVPRSAVSWQLPAMDVSKAAATPWPGTAVRAGIPLFWILAPDFPVGLAIPFSVLHYSLRLCLPHLLSQMSDQHGGLKVLPAYQWSIFLFPLTGVNGGGNGNPLQYCCLENPMDGGAW